MKPTYDEVIEVMTEAMYESWRGNEMSPKWVKNVPWIKAKKMAVKDELFAKWCDMGRDEAKAALHALQDMMPDIAFKTGIVNVQTGRKVENMEALNSVLQASDAFKHFKTMGRDNETK